MPQMCLYKRLSSFFSDHIFKCFFVKEERKIIFYKNMIVINTTQKTMKVVGLLFTASETFAYKIYRWISFGILCALFEPSCHFLLENYNNLIRATEVCIYIAAEGVMMAKAIFMFFNHKLIRSVLEDLQLMANKSKQISGLYAKVHLLS